MRVDAKKKENKQRLYSINENDDRRKIGNVSIVLKFLWRKTFFRLKDIVSTDCG